MGNLRLSPSGGGGDLDVITAGAADVVAPKVIVDKDGEPITGTMPDKGAWVGSVGMNGSVAIPAGKHNGAGKVNGPAVTQRGAWTGRIGVNGKAVIPQGYHSGAGYVDQAINNRGSLAKSLSINETFWLPEGYYSGGYVNQGIPTYGALAYTPNKATQTAYVSGRYMTGNVTIHPIPGNYVDMTVNQSVFYNGAFGAVFNRGWKKAQYSGNGDSVQIESTNYDLRAPVISGGVLQFRMSMMSYVGFIGIGSIDFSHFSKIRVTLNAIGNPSGDKYLNIAIVKNPVPFSSTHIKVTELIQHSWRNTFVGYGMHTKDYDISAVNEQGFLCIHCSHSSWQFDIHSIELIK